MTGKIERHILARLNGTSFGREGGREGAREGGRDGWRDGGDQSASE